MATLAAFYETRNVFRTYVNYSKPLTFEEWVQVPDEQKVAVLYLQFFNEITLAWDKANQFDFIDGEDGVTTALQYLQKQVCDRYIKGHPKKKVSDAYFFAHRDECEERRVIESDKKKFNPGYIYRICYNSLYCICHDLQSVKDRWDNETSGTIMYDGKELSLFDTVADRKGSAEDMIYNSTFEKEFWSIIEDSGVKAEKVMRYLLSGDEEDLKKLSTRNKNYKADPLRDVEVSVDSLDSILGHLRKKFMSLPHNSVCGSYVSKLTYGATC